MGNRDNTDSVSAALNFFDNAPHMYLILSPALTILTGSAIYLQTTQKKQDDITGKYIFDVFPLRQNDPEEGGIKHSLEQVLATKKPHQLPIVRFDVPNVSGVLQERYWYTSNTPILNNTGSIQYIIHHTQEVTEQVLAEHQLKNALLQHTTLELKASLAGRQLEKLLMEIPARISILTGPDFLFEFVNPFYQRQYPNKQIVGKTLLELFPEVASGPLQGILTNVYTTGESYEGKEVPVYMSKQQDNSNPELSYFNFIYQARYDESGKIIGVLSFSYDITELVKARLHVEQSEEELQTLNEQLAQTNEELQVSGEELFATNEELTATNEDLVITQETLHKLNTRLEEKVAERTAQVLRERDRLNRFFMQAPAGICVLDGPDMVFELVNPGYQKFFPGRELLGKPITEALPELKSTPLLAIIKQVYATGKSYEGNEVSAQIARYEDSAIEDLYFNFVYQARHDADNKVDGIMVFAYEVTETVLNRRREQEADKRFRFMLNAIPQQVWTATPEGALDYVNQVIVDDFGYTGEAIVGHGWQEFIHPDDLANCLQKWVSSLQNGTEYMVEFRLKFKDGQYLWHLARAVPLIEDGHITLWLGTNTNIDFQKNNEQRKDEFLSIASHELKTPLTSIKAFNQLMQRSGDAEKLAGFTKKSADHILRLEKLINDLLDVTKINAGKMSYNMQPFNFKQMLADSIESVQATTNTHTIEFEAGDDILYTGDQLRLEQVINNFLNNAVKYSPDADRIIVKYAANGENLIVSIQDFGIGIAPQNANRLFERYFRVDNTAMHFEGLGLGLFISSEILKRHNGSFWIESDLGKGATFFFQLPLAGR